MRPARWASTSCRQIFVRSATVARARITNRMRLTRTLHGTGFETKSVAPAAYPLLTDAESSAPGNHDHRHVTSLGGVAKFSADFGGPSIVGSTMARGRSEIRAGALSSAWKFAVTADDTHPEREISQGASAALSGQPLLVLVASCERYK